MGHLCKASILSIVWPQGFSNLRVFFVLFFCIPGDDQRLFMALYSGIVNANGNILDTRD